MKCRCLSILTSVAFAVILGSQSLALAQTLGSAEGFAVLGATAVTNTGSSVIRGSLGISPGATSSITGFPPGTVYGTTYAADSVALAAQGSAVTLYDSLAAMTCTTTYAVPTDIGGSTLTPGVYCFSSSGAITGTLTLNATSASDVFVFKFGSTLTTASGSAVVMSASGSPCNVFWQVGSSATLGTTTSFLGNIVALTSITLNTGANVTGRTLARNGAVTLDGNSVNASTCGAVATSVPVPVPALPGWAIIMLAALLALAGFAAMRRRAM